MILAWLLNRFDKRLALEYLRFVHERRMYVYALRREFDVEFNWREMQKFFEGYGQ